MLTNIKINKQRICWMNWTSYLCRFAGKPFHSVIRVVSRSFRCFKYTKHQKFVSRFVFALFVFMIYWAEVYSEPSSRTFQDGALAKIVNEWKSIKIFTKSLILDALQDSEYASAKHKVNYLTAFAIF